MVQYYLLKEWIYPVLLFFFLFTFLALFFSSIGITILSFWQKALILFITGIEGSFTQKILFSTIYLFLFLFFLYLIKLEFFPAFPEYIVISKDDVGAVKVSQKAIMEIVEKKLSPLPFVKTLKTYLTTENLKFVLHLKIDLVGNDSDTIDIREKAYSLAQEVREYIFNTTGIKISRVDVTIEGLKYNFREEERENG